jgi:hypothetical protein
MGIPNMQAGGIGMLPRQPLFFFTWFVWFSRSAPSTRIPVRVGLAALAFLVGTGASAAPITRLLTVRFSGDCQAYTIAVTGEGLKQPNPTVSYNIMLTPRSGEPMTIVDSFPVTPEKDGRFHKTIEGTWKKFEFTLTDRYTLSGSALLDSDLTLLHTLAITFSRKNLNCASNRPAR